MDEFRVKVKKARKICIIATIIVVIFSVCFTVVEVSIVASDVSKTMLPADEGNLYQDPNGAVKSVYSIFELFMIGFGSLGVILYVIFGAIIALIGLAIIWITFLIYYLVIKNRYKKQ